jgi:predicted metal-dependent peptidase
MIDEYLNPKLPWQQLLYNQMKEFKGSSDYQWYPFSRGHIYREIYLPSLMGDGIELNVCIDTSGSISIKQAQYFLSEILGITNTFGNYIIHYFEADCALTVNNLIITPDENKVPMEIKGRGGTSFVPYFKEIEKLELDHLPTLYFTDMDGTMPTKSYPNVFWLVVEGQNVTKEPKFGKILEIPVEKAGANPNWRKPVQLPNVGVIKRKVRR